MARALDVVGLYGMLAFATAQRTREIGVRIAFGARPGAMRVSVLRQGLELCVVGLVLGLVAASRAARLDPVRALRSE